jgi:hypothetical protein
LIYLTDVLFQLEYKKAKLKPTAQLTHDKSLISDGPLVPILSEADVNMSSFSQKLPLDSGKELSL